METIYFSLGIAIGVVTVIAVVNVIAIVKLSNLTTQLRNLEQTWERGMHNVHHELAAGKHIIETSMDDRFRDMHLNNESMCRNSDERFDIIHRHIDDISKEFNDQHAQLNRYIDSRIDKLPVNKKKETLTA